MFFQVVTVIFVQAQKDARRDDSELAQKKCRCALTLHMFAIASWFIVVFLVVIFVPSRI